MPPGNGSFRRPVFQKEPRLFLMNQHFERLALFYPVWSQLLMPLGFFFNFGVKHFERKIFSEMGSH